MKPKKYVALRYMAEFECIGPECEDNCCNSWNIYVDQSHYKKMKRVLTSPEEQALFDRSLTLRAPAERTARAFAVIQLDEKKLCPFLAEDKLCNLHKKFGGDILSDTCMIYPRVISQVGDRVELAGELSCPEVVRRAILKEDGVELVEIPRQRIGREIIRQSVTDEVADAEVLDEVRGTMYQLLQRVEYPVDSRYFFLAALARQVGPLFAGDADVETVRIETDAFARPEMLDGLHDYSRRIPVDGALTLGIAVQSLQRRLGDSAPMAFRRVLTAVLRGYEGNGVEITADGKLRISALELYAAWEKRRPAALAAFPEGRLELYFQNYGKHYVLRDWGLFEQGMSAHVLNLAWRAAMLRFLLLNHPNLAAAAGDPEAIDKIAVEVFYAFGRSIDHAARNQEMAVQVLAHELPALEHCIALLRL